MLCEQVAQVSLVSVTSVSPSGPSTFTFGFTGILTDQVMEDETVWI